MDPNIQRHDSLLLITSPIVKLKCKREIPRSSIADNRSTRTAMAIVRAMFNGVTPVVLRRWERQKENVCTKLRGRQRDTHEIQLLRAIDKFSHTRCVSFAARRGNITYTCVYRTHWISYSSGNDCITMNNGTWDLWREGIMAERMLYNG